MWPEGLLLLTQIIEPVSLAVAGGTYTVSSIGVGVERLFARQVSARLEYLYDDFGHKTYTTGDDTYRVGVKGHTVRGALQLRGVAGRSG